MQRRAAAAYVTFFHIIAISAYGVAILLSPPLLDAENELTQNQAVTVNGTTYNVTEVTSYASSGIGGTKRTANRCRRART